MLRQTILLFIFILLNVFGIYANGSEVSGSNVVKLDKYQNAQANTIKIEVPFARSLSKEKITAVSEELKQLEGKIIYHVDLVYTSFRKAPDFDQEKLNEDRMSHLKQWIPEVAKNNPKWTAYEQTGAKDRARAKSYFHGFVIHYGVPTDRNHFTSHVNGMEKSYTAFTIDNQKGAIIKNEAGTYISIPANAVKDQNGELVEGSYEIQYREYRNAAEMALSGIPMFYHEGGVDEVFNSVGMFEIRASQNEKDLVLDKNIEINFQTTDILPNVSFFKMDDASGEWTKEHAITFDDPVHSFNDSEVAGASKYKVTRDQMQGVGHQIKVTNYRPEGAIDNGGFQGYSFIRKNMVIDKDQVYCVLNRRSYETFKQLGSSVDSIQDMVLSIQKRYRGVLIPREKAKSFIEAITGESILNLEIERNIKETIYSLEVPESNASEFNLVGDEPIPNTLGLVKGLQVKGFGVYNCDQTLRIEEPIALNPTYYDKEDGSVLEDLYVACVIDLNLNASLTYHPNHLVCNKKGETKAIIFTNAKEIFLVETSAFKKVELVDGPIVLEVENITAQIKRPADLKRVLAI